MKNYFNYFRLLLIAFMFAFAADAFAQKETLAEGTNFWFGIPDVHIGLKEGPRGSSSGASEELFITSKMNTNVRIYNATGGLIKSVAVTANELKIVGLPSGYQHRISEEITNDKAFRVESDEPISLIVYVAWYKTGEAFRIIPVDWLGTEYYTLNLYLDKCKMIDNGTIEGGSSTGRDNVIHPAQILIVATEDNTEVQYWPTANTVKVKAGKEGKVKLNKGQTFLIQGDTSNPLMVQYEETDISGTRIRATKNIAVYSGHTKSAFPKFAPRYFGSYSADFLRNMLFDSMWPVSMLGKEYVTAPIKWFGRTYQHLIADDEGDLLRFIATADNTTLYEMKADGSGWQILIKGMKSGQYFDILSRTTPGYFKSNNKILVGQYGKGWFKWSGGIVPKAEDETSKEDELQNPPYSGEGMLYAVTPNEHWSNFAGYASVPTQTNFFTMIFKTGDEVYINIDGANIKTTYGGKIKKILGTPYSFLSEQSNVGGHFAETTNKSALFALYAYGHTDAHKDGFAYGYPAAVNYYAHCIDTVMIDAAMQCNVVTGTVTAKDLNTDTLCAAIQSFREIKVTGVSGNAKLSHNVKAGSTSGTFTVTFPDKTKEGYCKVVVVTKSGSTDTKEFYYYPETVSGTPNIVSYTKLEANEVRDTTIVIKNTSTKKELRIKELYLKNKNKAFTIVTTPVKDIVIPIGGSLPYTIRTKVEDPNVPTIKDELWAKMECDSSRLTFLSVSTGLPLLAIEDAIMGQTTYDKTIGDNPAKYALYKDITIKNEGSNPTYITGYQMDPTGDNTKFSFEKIGNEFDLTKASVSNPLVLEANSNFKIKVKYNFGTDENKAHRTSMTLLSSNATQTKLVSEWSANVVNSTLAVSGFNWENRRVIDAFAPAAGYKAKFKITNNGSQKIKFDKVQLCEVGTTNKVDDTFPIVMDDPTFNVIDANGVLEVPVTFKPMNQEASVCEILVTGYVIDNDGNVTTQIRLANSGALLQGYGQQPHLTTTSVPFARINLTETSLKKTDNQFVTVKATNIMAQDSFAMPLTITDLTITGTDAEFYQIDKSAFTMPTEANPKVLNVNEELLVPVIFSPKQPRDGDFVAQLNVICDAPVATTDLNNDYAPLVGKAYNYGIAATPTEFPVTYRTLTAAEQTVEIENSGSTPVTFVRSILASLEDANSGIDKACFNLKGKAKLVKANTEIDYTNSDFVLPAGDKLVITLDFAPLAAKVYNAQINYQFVSKETPGDEDKILYETSNIKGTGKEYFATVEIATDYKANPGQLISSEKASSKELVEFKLYKNNTKENKSIDDANITEFTARFQFATEEKDKGSKHVYPVIENNKPKIIIENTMTQGWTVVNNEIIGDSVLSVTMKGTNPLKASNSDILFKLPMRGYLSLTDVKVPLKPSFTPNNNYTTMSNIDGDAEIKKVCIDNARLVTISGMSNNPGVVSPNPVNRQGVINYSNAISCPVTLEIFNANGMKVATIVNEYQKAGAHQAIIDTEALNIPSGNYTYRITMGEFSATNTIVITK